MDINVELFRRTSKITKIAIVKNMNSYDINQLNYKTVVKMFKTLKRDKLYTGDQKLASNNWNALIESVDYNDDTLYMNIYVQGDSSDYNKIVSWCGFFTSPYRDYKGYVETYYGNLNFSFTPKERENILRAICLAYIEAKYKK